MCVCVCVHKHTRVYGCTSVRACAFVCVCVCGNDYGTVGNGDSGIRAGVVLSRLLAIGDWRCIKERPFRWPRTTVIGFKLPKRGPDVVYINMCVVFSPIPYLGSSGAAHTLAETSMIVRDYSSTPRLTPYLPQRGLVVVVGSCLRLGGGVCSRHGSRQVVPSGEAAKEALPSVHMRTSGGGSGSLASWLQTLSDVLSASLKSPEFGRVVSVAGDSLYMFHFLSLVFVCFFPPSGRLSLLVFGLAFYFSF